MSTPGIQGKGAAAGGPDAVTTAPLLEVESLRRSFAGVQAVTDVSFEVRAGSLLGLIGPNGAGKSTVMNIIAGSIPAEAGTIRFRGQVINSLSDYQRARSGIIRVFQHPAEFGQMTVLENLLVAHPGIGGQGYRSLLTTRRRAWREQEEQAIADSLELLDRVELRRAANDYAAALSGGQKKLLDLLRAVSAQPALLLLDEPFAGVHIRNVEAVCALLTGLRERGVTILMTEHELSLVERLCDAAIVMARGSVIFRGSLEQGLQDREVVEAYVAG